MLSTGALVAVILAIVLFAIVVGYMVYMKLSGKGGKKSSSRKKKSRKRADGYEGGEATFTVTEPMKAAAGYNAAMDWSSSGEE